MVATAEQARSVLVEAQRRAGSLLGHYPEESLVAELRTAIREADQFRTDPLVVEDFADVVEVMEDLRDGTFFD